jgi:NAD(P)-dependent dehydrogenase (short-subunit alcohol dehydrogenase family)
VAVVYLEEHKDARETEHLVEEHGRKCLLIDGNIGDEKFCRKAVEQAVDEFGKVDILVNNAAEQHPQDSIEKITEKTTRANISHEHFCDVFHDESGDGTSHQRLQSLTPLPSRLTKGVRTCSITPQLKAQ